MIELTRTYTEDETARHALQQAGDMDSWDQESYSSIAALLAQADCVISCCKACLTAATVEAAVLLRHEDFLTACAVML